MHWQITKEKLIWGEFPIISSTSAQNSVTSNSMETFGEKFYIEASRDAMFTHTSAINNHLSNLIVTNASDINTFSYYLCQSIEEEIILPKCLQPLFLGWTCILIGLSRIPKETFTCCSEGKAEL